MTTKIVESLFTCTIRRKNNILTPGGFELVLVLVGADGADGKVVHVGQGRRVQTVRRPILKKTKFEDLL